MLELIGIRKRFPGVLALDGVDLVVEPGEIHAVVGENGAGKSTLMNIVAGILDPDEGDILLDGKSVGIRDPREARAVGIGICHQELELFEGLTVGENVLLPVGLPTRCGVIQWWQVEARAREALRPLGIDLPLRSTLHHLGPSERGLIQVAAAIAEAPRFLLMDEPTASLSAGDAEQVARNLTALARSGAGVLYVSHRLEEVLDLADRVTVLRDGQRIWTRSAADTSMEDVVRAMVGRQLDVYYPTLADPEAEPALEVEELTDLEGRFRGVTLSLRRGEILGVYGLVGAGRSEFGQALVGLRPARGALWIGGRSCRPWNPGHGLAHGIAYLPEDRRTQGIVHGRPVRENLTLTALPRVSPAGWIASRREESLASRTIADLEIATTGTEIAVDTLSGGNQQKVLLGRWLATDPRILVLDEPTRGVDVAAKAEIHRRIAGLARAGRGVVLISSELPEVMGMCHRAIVFREGEIAGTFDPRRDTQEAIARAALPVGRSPEGRDRRSARAAGVFANREMALVLAIAAISLVTAWIRPEFLQLGTLVDLLRNNAALIIASMGMTLVIANGGIDLSVGSILAIAGAVGTLSVHGGVPLPAAILLAGLAGACLAAINALLATTGRVHPIIATLGTMGIFRGIYLLWTGGDWIEAGSIAELDKSSLLVLPPSVWIAVLWIALGHVILTRTVVGRSVLAAGGNLQAAAVHGLPFRRVRCVAFGILGASMGLASMLYIARFGTLQNNTGVGYELEVIAAAVVGGAHIAGGRGTAAGALLGALLVGLTGVVRNLVGVPEEWQKIIVGGLMLGAIALESGLRRIAGVQRFG